jgi:hypothetical protein
MKIVRPIAAAAGADKTAQATEEEAPPALVFVTAGIIVQIVAEELVLLAASVGCGTLIARFALAQLFRAAGIGRRRVADQPRSTSVDSNSAEA